MAEAPTMEVRARLSAETAQFTKGMEQARRSADELTQASNRLRGAVVGVGVVAGTATAALIGFGVKAFNAAARVDELNIALNAVGKSTGFGYEKLNETALAIKSMGIEMEIAQKATLKYAQNNLDLAKASEVARVAQDLAVIGAMNSSDAFDRLTHAIITGRSEVLKSVGIQKSAGAAYADYASSIGKAAKDLTATEKQAAVLNLVLEEGARVAGTYEAAMTTPGKVLRSFARLHNDLAVSMGSVLISGFGPMIFESYELYKQFVKAVGGTGAFKSILEALELVLVKLTTPVTAFVKGLGSMIDRMNKAKISTEGLAEAIEFVLPVFAALGTAAAVTAGKQIFEMVPILGSVLQKLSPLPVAMLAMALTSTQVRNAMINLLSALKPLLTPLTQLAKISAGIAAYGVAILAKAINALANVVRKIITFVQENIRVFQILGTIIGVVAIGYGAYRLAIIGAGIATAAWTTITQTATTVTALFTTAQRMLNSTIALNPIPLLIGVLAGLVTAFVVAWKNSETFREVMTNVFNTVAKVFGNAVSWIISGIGNLLIAFGYLISTNETFGQVVATVMNTVVKIYTTAYIAIITGIKYLIDTFYSLMNTNESLRSVVTSVMNTVSRVVAYMVTAVVTQFANIIKAIATAVYIFEKFLSVAKTIFGGIIKAVGAMATGIGNVLKKALGFIVEKFLATLVGKVGDLVAFLVKAAGKIPFIGDKIASFFGGMSDELSKAERSLRSFSNTAENIGASETDSAVKTIDAVSGVSTALIKNAKSWGNYETGVAGALSTIANKMLDFNQKLVDFAADDQATKVISGLITGAKTASSGLGTVLDVLKGIQEANVGTTVVESVSKGAVEAGKFLLGLAGGIKSFTSENFVGKVGEEFGKLFDSLKEGLGFGDILAEEKRNLKQVVQATIFLKM